MRPDPVRLVAYLRVSTKQQEESKLGLEAQLAVIKHYAHRTGAVVIREFSEVASGVRKIRPILQLAKHYARDHKATLVVAHLDRLSREARFLLEVLDGDIPVIFCNCPDSGRTEQSLMAVFAEHEWRRISERCRQAAAAKRARGDPLGRLENLVKHGAKGTITSAFNQRTRALDQFYALALWFAALRNQGLGLRAIARRANERGVKTAAGKEWYPAQVKRVLERLVWHDGLAREVA